MNIDDLASKITVYVNNYVPGRSVFMILNDRYKISWSLCKK